MKHTFRHRYLPLAISLFAGAPNAALAESGVMQLEELIVTAQKRTQSMQEVPVAMQAVSADQLQQASVDSLSDLAAVAPGLSISDSQSSAFTGIAVRGVSTATLGVGVEASTALYVDGVYQRDIAPVSSLMDVAQVEVLKGPQGTLFGRNAAAGAVNIRTAKPEEDFGGSLSVSFGNEDFKSVAGTLNVPLTDELHNRTSFTQRQRDGWQQDTDSADADKLYEQDNIAIRNRTLWYASNEITAELILDYSNKDGTRGGYVVEETGSLDPFAGFSQTHSLDGDKASQSGLLYQGGELVPFNSDASADSKGAALIVEWELNDELSFTSISSYRDSSTDTAFSSGALFSLAEGFAPYLPAYVGTVEFEYQTFNQELRLSGVSDSIDWFVGLNYFKDDGSQRSNYALPLFAAAAPFTGLPATGQLGDALSSSDVDIESYAVFGDFIFALTDLMSLTVGARYSYDKKSIEWQDVAQLAPDVLYPDIANGVVRYSGLPASGKDDWNDLSGRLVLDYQLDDDVMVYASVSQGYKSGGFNSELTVVSDPSESFDQEKSTSYEIGLKSTALDGRLQANASVFFNSYDSYQFQASAPGSIAVLNLGADAEISGAEVNLSWLPLENLTMTMNVSYLDAEFVEDVTATGVTGTALVVESGQDMMRAPQWVTQLGADYSITLADSAEIRMNASYYYSESYRLNNARVDGLQGNGIVFSESDLRSGTYGLLNARVTYVAPGQDWEVSLWGTNLTDESYRDYDWVTVANAVYSGFGASTRAYHRNEPKMYGIDVRYHF